ncbi:hypothetical protein GWK47_043610 [Chionoecetes opilio]|uniref:Uncharacterized protein n=1 Tax=Chionoecetes opilio TaxID=41210 RepID=A0A8J4YFZ7_CHIOP|nr:hypothetical protein GWK47_043610 [Chionoecetes opilio]
MSQCGGEVSNTAMLDTEGRGRREGRQSEGLRHEPGVVQSNGHAGMSRKRVNTWNKMHATAASPAEPEGLQLKQRREEGAELVARTSQGVARNVIPGGAPRLFPMSNTSAILPSAMLFLDYYVRLSHPPLCSPS